VFATDGPPEVPFPSVPGVVATDGPPVVVAPDESVLVVCVVFDTDTPPITVTRDDPPDAVVFNAPTNVNV
jgi:hypothetical protein